MVSTCVHIFPRVLRSGSTDASVRATRSATGAAAENALLSPGDNACFLNASLQVTATDTRLVKLVAVAATIAVGPCKSDSKSDRARHLLLTEASVACQALHNVLSRLSAGLHISDSKPLRTAYHLSLNAQEDTHTALIKGLDAVHTLFLAIEVRQ